MVEHHTYASVGSRLFIVGVEDRYLVANAVVFCALLLLKGSTLLTYAATGAFYAAGVCLYAWNPQWLSLVLLLRHPVNRHHRYDSRRRQ